MKPTDFSVHVTTFLTHHLAAEGAIALWTRCLTFDSQ